MHQTFYFRITWVFWRDAKNALVLEKTINFGNRKKIKIRSAGIPLKVTLNVIEAHQVLYLVAPHL